MGNVHPYLLLAQAVSYLCKLNADLFNKLYRLKVVILFIIYKSKEYNSGRYVTVCDEVAQLFLCLLKFHGLLHLNILKAKWRFMKIRVIFKCLKGYVAFPAWKTTLLKLHECVSANEKVACSPRRAIITYTDNL